MFFELYKNGKKLCIAGYNDHAKLSFRILHDNKFDEAVILLDGELISVNNENKQAEWVNETIQNGDEVVLKCLGKAIPDEPKNSSGTVAHIAEAYCSFCGRSKNEVPKLLAGKGVFICNECVDICKESLDRDKSQ